MNHSPPFSQALFMFRPFNDPFGYLEGLKRRQTLALVSQQFENLGSGVADHQSMQASQVACACSSAYETASLTFNVIQGNSHGVLVSSNGKIRFSLCDSRKCENGGIPGLHVQAASASLYMVRSDLGRLEVVAMRRWLASQESMDGVRTGKVSYQCSKMFPQAISLCEACSSNYHSSNK